MSVGPGAVLLVLVAAVGGCRTDKVGVYVDGPLDEVDESLERFRGTPDRRPGPGWEIGRWDDGR